MNLRLALVAALLSAACAVPHREHEHPILIPLRRVQLGPSPTLVEPTDRPSKGYIDHARSPEHDLVQLWLRDSFYVGKLAYHPFFLAYDREQNRWEQWEVWAGDQFGFYETSQKRALHRSDGEDELEVTYRHRQFGAVRNWTPMTYLEIDDSEHLAGEWTGDDARRVIEVLRRPRHYPHHDTYWIWPGPNSNGYARWVLAEAGVGIDLDPKMIGKDWLGPLGCSIGLTPTRTGLHVDALSFGVAVGVLDGVELHFLGATLGLDLWPPAVKTPFGRLGFPE